MPYLSKKGYALFGVCLSLMILGGCSGAQEAGPQSGDGLERPSLMIRQEHAVAQPTVAAEPVAPVVDEQYDGRIVPGKNHNKAASAYAFPASEVQDWLQNGAASPTYPSEKLVFLTIDDGPTNRVTPLVLDALLAGGAPATFFYLAGMATGSDPAIINRTVAEGHAIAPHSAGHDYNVLYPQRSANKEAILADYAATDRALKSVLGEAYFSSAYRYPGGHMSWKNLASTDQAMAAQGMYWIDWNNSTGDATNKPVTPEGLAANVTGNIRPDWNVVVVLMHDSSSKTTTAQALPLIIEYFTREGWRFGIIE